MDKVRLGIIGLGGMGSAHINNYLSGAIKGAVITAVCDVDDVPLNKALELLGGGVKGFKCSDELIDSGLVDAVLIATPHYFHPPIAIRALGSGLNVLTEKPAGVYTKAVREMNEAAEKSGKVFGIMYNQRTNPRYATMRRIIRNGELGGIKRIVWTITNWYRPQSYYDSGTWRATWSGEGGGVLLNQDPHQLDLFQWMFGMPKKVRAFMSFGKYHDIEVEDDVTAYMEYEDGTPALFITSTGEYPGANRLEVSGDNGKITIDEDGKIVFQKNSVNEREFNRTWKNGFGSPTCERLELPAEGGDNSQHVGILNNFIDAILTGAPLLAPGCEGIRGLTLSNAFHLSAWTDSTVELPLDEELYLRLLKERIASSKAKKTASGLTMEVSGTFNSK